MGMTYKTVLNSEWRASTEDKKLVEISLEEYYRVIHTHTHTHMIVYFVHILMALAYSHEVSPILNSLNATGFESP